MLPRLLTPPLDKQIQSGVGKYSDPCEKCQLNDVCIRNCCHDKCSQHSCYRDCNNCGGSVLEDEDSNVPGICCKSPLQDLYIPDVRRESYEFTKRRRIRMKAHSVCVINGSAGTIPKWYPDGTEAIAINYRHAWSPEGRGWRSQDMRDYLKIPDGTKLILLTATLDDVLERAWNFNFHHEDYEKVGFDYWQALEFSLYDDMSHMNNLWLSYRNLYVQSVGGAHFSHLPPFPLKLDRKSARPWRRAALRAPNLLVNFQSGNLNKKEDREAFVRMMGRVRKWMEFVGKPMTLWVNGVLSPETAYNVVINAPEGVSCRFLSMAPWLFANKGSELTDRGTATRSTLPRAELLLLNQERYVNLISQTIGHAERAIENRSGGKTS